MRPAKSIFPVRGIDIARDGEQEERELALEYLADAWNSASEDGIEGEALAHAALFAAIATLVRDYGEEAVSKMIGDLPERIDCGEYTLDRVLQ